AGRPAPVRGVLRGRVRRRRRDRDHAAVGAARVGRPAARDRTGAARPHPHRPAVADRRAGRDVAARGRRGRPAGRRAVPVLTEHRLRIGDRRVTLVEGPAGWGECSPWPGYPCDPAAARRAAEEAASVGFPARVRAEVRVNALVQGRGFEPRALAGYPCVKVKVGAPGDVDLVAAVRDAVGPGVALRVDANGAWDVETAVDRLRVLARYGLELAEH